MITRSYVCDSCYYAFRTKQPMLEPLKKKCPKCGRKKLYQDLTGTSPPIIITPRTIGGLADRNAQKMKDKVEESKKVKNKSWYNASGQDLKKDLRDVVGDKDKIRKYVMEGR